ncbi:hypothetical protein L1987_74192 [Smallanthus sonchifolius]|uniref:Uncharacterized protein n=1 Tax=Smallanthus sonchifolius TaxID=185202 RepID=A0ACB9A357_9ASTR|nr:hypothetical protein L1987_74192 [Smallanthus sonchifolius]
MYPTNKSSSLLFLISTCFTSLVRSICTRGCDLALGSYYLEPQNDIVSISQSINTSITNILNYNPDTISNKDSLPVFTRLIVPFSCECLNGDFLGHVFNYEFRSVDTYERVAEEMYANLTTGDWIRRFNVYDPNRVPDHVIINVTVNCSCGDGSVSKDYGLFVTYPLRPGESLESVSLAANLSSELVRRYNPGVNFSQGSGLVYIPGRGLSVGAIAGITLGVVAVVLFLAGCLYIRVYRNKNAQLQLMLAQAPNGLSIRGSESSGVPVAGLTGIEVDISVEFSYKELSTATNNFSDANKIGQGGFGVVYYAELRGEKAAIKKMDMESSKQFLAELKVLTRVHHLNLVRLIGYCVKGSLFLVYEYIENGNLSQHLHASGRNPLPWSTRIQVALDSARGLEYIHEHTVPVYVHCDIKSENILVDKNFHGKVADFGLTRLTKVGSKSRLADLPSPETPSDGHYPTAHCLLLGLIFLCQTTQWTPLLLQMAQRPALLAQPKAKLPAHLLILPQHLSWTILAQLLSMLLLLMYLRLGEVSPKVDVYAFGVVLYELISAKQAVIRANDSDLEPKSLTALFDEVLSQPDPKDDLVKMIDPRLGDNYPLDSVHKMAQLAKACTHVDPQRRPSMRYIVVELITLSSFTEDWDVGSFYGNQTLVRSGK